MNFEVFIQNWYNYFISTTMTHLKRFFFLSVFFLIKQYGIGQTLPLLSNSSDYQMVFQDEFNGTALDWSIWQSDDAITTSPSRQTVGRWKENCVVENGLLKLFVKKGNRTDSQWTAGYVYLKQLFGVNTYYETRFRITNATGINNAFWTACKSTLTSSTSKYLNHYEIDAIEAKRADGSNSITGGISWHDWKTYLNGSHVASSYKVTYNTIDFQTWGLWVGEDNFIVYCDGVEQWRGTNNATYPNAWNTGVGNISSWMCPEEKRAFGKWGQSDWNYTGGMNGDDMNICFSNLPWSTPISTLTDAANNTSMDIDYMRIYKLKTELNTSPTQTVLIPKAQQTITLTKPINLNSNQNYYFAFVASHPANSLISCALSSNTQSEITFKIKQDNELSLLDNISEVSSATSYPATDKIGTHFEAGRKYLFIGRITASTTAKDIISFTSFDLGQTIPSSEPFLYRNIDDYGNTSFSNEWTINNKVSSSKVLTKLTFTDIANNCQFSDLIFSNNYASLIAKFQNIPKVNFYGETKPGNKQYVYFNLEGKFPFSVTYTDGKQQFTVNNIAQSSDTIAVTPVGVAQYSIVSATDADGKSAIVDGIANFYGTDANFIKIAPSFDTFLSEGSTINSHTAADLLLKNFSGAAQESFLVFKLPNNQSKTDRANLAIYFTSKSIATPIEIELMGSTAVVDSTTTWDSAPSANNWESIDKKVLGSALGYYIDFDLTAFCNARFANNQQTITLKIRQILGDSSNVTKLKQTHNATTYVPTFMMVKKVGTTDVPSLFSSEPLLSLHPQTRQLSNCSDLLVSKVLIYNSMGQLLVQSNTLPLIIPTYLSGVLIVHVVTSDHTFIQKFNL